MSAPRARNSIEGALVNGCEARPPLERGTACAAAATAEVAAAASAAAAAKQCRRSNATELDQIVSSSRRGSYSVAGQTFRRRAPAGAKTTVSTAEDVPADCRFERLFSLNVPQRLEGDITDRSFAAVKPEARRQTGVRVLGGGRLHNAMEIVEILIADDNDENAGGASQTDDGAFELHLQQELAKQYSIGKCVAWMESLRLADVDTSATTAAAAAAKTVVAAATTAT